MVRCLLLLNGLAVVGAVVNHASGWGFTALFWWTDRYQPVTAPDFSQLGTPTYYALRVVEQSITFSLPAFLFVSGYFVAFAAGRDQLRLGWDKVSARLRMLLIPYVLWSVAILVGRSLEGATHTSLGYVEQILFGRAAEPYYYIPLITQLYLLSPLIVGRLKDHWKPILLGAALLQLVVQVARYPVILGADVPMATWVWRHAPGWFFPHMVFWFVLGAVACVHLGPLKCWLARWKPWLPWIAAAAGVTAFVEWELLLGWSGRSWVTPTPTVLDSVFSLAFILTFLTHADSTVLARWRLGGLGERSLGVYLIHAPVLELMSRACYHGAPVLLAHQFVFQILLVVVGVALPLLLMRLVNRSPARAYYNYIFG